ncbi:MULTISPECIES: ABC transporter ATP-binding protein [unclassified Arthrobacter]|uniref:ABC transporter ATP-binding protein n=1 Tax=unclassified Arthrobacter TaxID=235627 RepID=UPI00159D21BD|nr:MULTISPECIES: ABC transporter ATP-binding protein [unclassified Arthrobacter]MCQ9165864.1 ABC transporter ATP-binding protein [Arthrobacter sp. STN4]NVM99886.1 ABC transporter ATP-binding protein [Arthrobacter sp. SDTb3-6]
MSNSAPTLVVDDLRIVGVPSMASIIDELTLEVNPGEILGVVGESGSGKTTLGLSLLNYCKEGTKVEGGTVSIRDNNLAALNWRQVRSLRGRTVAYIPQSPASALNPALRISTQLRECISGDSSTVLSRVREVLREVALPDDDDFLARYPHQLSGGQQQRVAIAMAFMARPALIVMDEPTTGLDVSTQEHVLLTVREMCKTYDCAAVYISHDMAVVAELADRIAVMYSGRIVEIGRTADVLDHPAHPYTSRLLLAVPDLEAIRPMVGIPGNAPSPMGRPQGCAFAPRCPLADSGCSVEAPKAVTMGERHSVRCFKAGRALPPTPARPQRERSVRAPEDRPVIDISGLKAGYGKFTVLEDISLSVYPGDCVALLGESGSGKTTLSRCIAGLHHNFTGGLTLDGEPLATSSFKRSPEQRRRVQYIFQNPYESLNPRRTVEELILQPVQAVRGRVRNARDLVATALERASLRPDHARRYPDQLSGGERQRVAIARALATEPEVLICDEITSALDVSVQSSLVDLLRGLQAEMGLTLLFITHNIALVRNMAQQVAVLERGRIVEFGDVADIFKDPQHAYTRSLMSATPNFQLPRQAYSDPAAGASLLGAPDPVQL